MEYIREYYKSKGYNRILVVPDEDVVKFYEKVGFRKWKELYTYEINPEDKKANFNLEFKEIGIKGHFRKRNNNKS